MKPGEHQGDQGGTAAREARDRSMQNTPFLIVDFDPRAGLVFGLALQSAPGRSDAYPGPLTRGQAAHVEQIMRGGAAFGRGCGGRLLGGRP